LDREQSQQAALIVSVYRQPGPDSVNVRHTQQPPIADYALIGDCHGSALVGRSGSIDWCCLRRFDADPVFFRILDVSHGGFWDIVPEGVIETTRSYLPGTNMLRTVFVTGTGTGSVTDFMPVGRSRDASVHDYVSLNAPCWLVRRFETIDGQIRFTSRVRPRGPSFATEPLKLSYDGAALRAKGFSLWCGGTIELNDDRADITFELSAGQVESAVLTQIEPLTDPRQHGDRLFEITRCFWQEWIEYSRYRGAYETAVTRSALALKLLTYAPTGAVVAAPTTSLPEEIGGERNWDYRYCWLRDSSFTLYSLGVLGYSGEARSFAEFLTRRCLREGATPHIMYSIDGEPFLPERILDQLAGYADSRPVRIGNGAFDQIQLDVHGEVLDLALLRRTLGGRLRRDEVSALRASANHVCRVWRDPDQGLWESRGDPRNFTHGKVMAWVALDRARKLFGDNPVWCREQDAILAAILSEGTTGDPPYLAQSFGREEVDAALLQIPLLGLPISRDLLGQTVRRIEQELRDGDFVHRYRNEDGVRGSEGAFLITSFWLVDALLVMDRATEARELFDRLLSHANDVGLYAEEIDPHSGAHLGNFPQAFTHLALISSASLLHLYDIAGAEGVSGTHADRARRLVGATEGKKALLYALWRNCRVRVFGSARSVMELH
jgi:GH15 family glucan-1,4-alpha-glucosidase